MNKTHVPEDGFEQMLRESLEQENKAIKERDNQDYDGIVGMPPPWVPEWAVSFFERYRKRLISVRGYTHKELLVLIAQYDEINDNPAGFRWVTTYPNGKRVDIHCFQDEISFLSWLRWCVNQGEEFGLVELSGKDGLLGYQRRKQLAQFGEMHAKELHKERAVEWAVWRSEAQKFIKKNPALAGNKQELAKRIKKALSLTDSVNTIRQRL